MLEVQNLSYSTKTFSMENVSFSLDDGYLMTLLGRNGAGKTTLFDLVYGRIEPLSGKVLWNDIDVTGMKAIDILYHDEVAYVGGRSWCIGGIRADENIRLLSCLYSRWDQKHFDEMLEMMEFTKEEYTTKFEELSTGKQMQLQLAFALARHPKLLLLDEPTNYLDVEHIEWLKRYLNDYENAFILISHDIPFLNSVVNLIYHMDNKKLDRYVGDYDKFMEVYEMKKAQLEAAYNKQQQEIKELKDFVARNKARVATRNMAMSRQKKLDKMDVIAVSYTHLTLPTIA